MLQGGRIIGQRLIEVPQHAVNDGPSVVRFGAVGVELNRPVVIGDGFLVLLGLVIGPAPLAIALGFGRLARNGRGQLGQLLLRLGLGRRIGPENRGGPKQQCPDQDTKGAEH